MKVEVLVVARTQRTKSTCRLRFSDEEGGEGDLMGGF